MQVEHVWLGRSNVAYCSLNIFEAGELLTLFPGMNSLKLDLLLLIIVKLQAIIFLLALIVRAANRPADYDSDEEYIGAPRQQIRQPLINRQPVPATGASAANTLEQRPSRNDAWSTRMREKVK